MKKKAMTDIPTISDIKEKARNLKNTDLCAIHSVSAEKLTQAFGIVGVLCDSIMKIATSTGKGHIDIDFNMDSSRALIAAYITRDE